MAVGAVAVGCGATDPTTGRPATSAPGRATTSTSAAPTTTTTTGPTGPARFVAHVPTTQPRVALTFHVDGDLDLAARYLSACKARDIVFTGFVVGQWLDANPSWARRLLDAGHELANHTYTHPTFASLSPSAMTDEIDRCRDLLVRLGGTPGVAFRPSGTADGTTVPSPAVLDVAGRAGYQTVLGFDVDPLDYARPGVDEIVRRTLAAVSPGAVISLHFNYPDTLAALPAIFDGLTARGLVPVTTSKLLASR
jgi:peptidoglycan/xylan/chitin deacetylase (PgdA/CDA1 family)